MGSDRRSGVLVLRAAAEDATVDSSRWGGNLDDLRIPNPFHAGDCSEHHCRDGGGLFFFYTGGEPVRSLKIRRGTRRLKSYNAICFSCV